MNTPISFPKVIRIEPASQCNLSCIHCPTGTIDMHRGIMQKSIFEKILQEVQLHKNEIKVIVLYHGGEPFLNKDFASMVQRLKLINPSFFIKTVSNGMALTQQRAYELIESGLDAIEFSLDGLSAQESELIRKKSDVTKIISNISYLIALKKKKQSNTPTIAIATTQFFSENYPTMNYPSPSTPKWILELFCKEDIHEFKTTYAMRWPHMKTSEFFNELTVVHPIDYIKFCDHVINTLTIRADGSIVPCCFDLTNQMIMGNILSDSLTTIWENTLYKNLRCSLLNFNEIPNLCRNCLVINNPIYLIPKWRLNERY